jgi:uracil-DNA glycosylase family protein
VQVAVALPPASAPSAERAAALEQVRRAAAGCQDCPLWELGTQTVFGVGPATATLMFVGEAPGRQEDERGVPFVGPAGQLFDEGLLHAGIDRAGVYVTNTVKHRPWIPKGARGKNRPPKQSEVNACRQWLERELTLVRPRLIVCLGGVAARAVLGRDFKVTQRRGEWIELEGGAEALATLHPSYVLIQPAESRDRVREMFFGDLQAVGERCRQLGGLG